MAAVSTFHEPTLDIHSVLRDFLFLRHLKSYSAFVVRGGLATHQKILELSDALRTFNSEVDSGSLKTLNSQHYPHESYPAECVRFERRMHGSFHNTSLRSEVLLLEDPYSTFSSPSFYSFDVSNFSKSLLVNLKTHNVNDKDPISYALELLDKNPVAAIVLSLNRHLFQRAYGSQLHTIYSELPISQIYALTGILNDVVEPFLEFSEDLTSEHFRTRYESALEGTLDRTPIL